MGTHRIAQALGRMGGKARARALPPEERRRIAAQGGLSRSLSRHAARRIEHNYSYLRAAQKLRRAGRRHGL